MVSIQKKKKPIRRLFCQLDYFDHDVNIGDAARSKKQNVANNDRVDREFSVIDTDSSAVVYENSVDVQMLKRILTNRNTNEMSNVVEKLEEKILNALLTAMDNIIIPRIELAVRSMKASSGQDIASVTTNSESSEQLEISFPYSSLSDRKSFFSQLNSTDETRGYNSD